MSYTCRPSSCHTSPLTSDFLVLFVEVLLVTTFADDKHFRLDDLHQTGLVSNATIRRKKDAWNAVICIVLWTSFRGLSIIKESLSAMLDNPDCSLPSSQELDIGPCSEPKQYTPCPPTDSLKSGLSCTPTNAHNRITICICKIHFLYFSANDNSN